MAEEQQDKIEILLTEFSQQRQAIMGMVTEVESLRGQMELLFPETIDARTRKFLEDKVKTMVSFYGVLLDMRKEISKNIKDEVEIRRRVEGGELGADDIEEMLDVRDIAKKMESFAKKKRQIQDDRLDKNKGIRELEDHGIEIPGLRALKDE